ncbi:hypothetical protein V9T40_013022 [Parthenolecanium corni]|uniref:Amino acid transporter transmembrane domain-containing protein n=1 Tax=Parthenolecanium corni TaxID=536013 RepID=A0AAN9XZP9_9HEMI
MSNVNISTLESKAPSPDQMKISHFGKEFDPYDYGMDDGYGLWGAAFHIIRYTFGTGILLLPYTLKTVGYANGIILLSLVSVFYFHNMHILISFEHQLCKLLKVKQITYSSLAKKTFENHPFPANKFGSLVSQVLLIYLCSLVCPSTYLLIFASSVQNLAKYFDLDWNIIHIITVAMVPILIFSMFRKLLKILVPFSAITNLFSLIMAAVLVTCCIIYRDPAANIRPFGDLNCVPQTVAAQLQAILCTLSILPIKNYMRQPQCMGSSYGALNISALALTFVYIIFALVSYLCFGENVEENILSNLPKNNFLSFIIHIMYATAMFVIYLLSFSVTFDNMWPDIELIISDNKYKVLIEFGTRIGINGWAYFLAVGIPNLALILTISGTLAIVFEVALVPGLELVLVFRSEKKCLLTIFKDIVIIIIVAILFYMSLVDCVKEVKKLYSEKMD